MQNKKINTALFLIGASLFNIVLLVVLILGLLTLGIWIMGDNPDPKTVQIVLGTMFVLALGLSFMAYHWVFQLFARKVDMEKYFMSFVIPRKKKF